MKILVAGNGYGYGGSQTAFRELAALCQEEGHAVGTIAITGGDDGLPRVDRVALRRSILPTNATFEHKVRKFVDLTLASFGARKFSPEIYVAVGFSNSANIIARAVGNRCFKLCVDVIAGRSVNNPYLKNAARLFDAIAVQSPSMVSMLRRQGFDGAPLGWLPCLTRQTVAGYIRRPVNGHIRLGYFGRLAANKGLDVLIGALADARLNEYVAFDIHGDGTERKKLEALKGSFTGRIAIEFKGPYPNGALGAELMCGYDALIVPSQHSEGVPLVLLEAMSYGVPVLTTNVGAIRDCCEDNPDFLLVDPSRASLSKGIEALIAGLNSGKFQTERLQAYYRNHFSRDVMAADWRRFFLQPREFFR